MKVYIHIGYPKTGSTAIQWHVFANKRWFENRGVYIPRTGYWSGLGHAYLIGLHKAETEASALSSNDAIDDLVHELNACAQQGYKAALLTWEGFPLASETAILALGKALVAYDVELLAYIRDQASLYQSLVLQGLKNLRDFTQIPAVEQGRPVNGIPDYLDFHTVLTRWKSNFSNKLAIRTRLFDRTILQEGDIVTDLLHWIELTPDDGFCLQSDGINDSLSTEGALQLINARSAGLPWGGMIRLSQALTTAYAETRSGHSRFLDDVGVEQVATYFAEANSRLFEDYRPENIAPNTDGFVWPQKSPKLVERQLEADSLKAVHRALHAPKLRSWGGGHLKDKNVGQLTVPPNQGWRGPEKTGAWSLGAQSELAFTIPSTHPNSGPSALRLILTGIYFEGHNATRVTINEHSELYNLHGEVVLTIAINDAVRAHGIRIVFDHQFPPASLDGENTHQPPLAYKLRAASYDFVWS